jgi:aminoglycoside 2'-N-acetyltransferase I
MQTLSFPEASTPSHLRQQVLDLQDEAWPPDELSRESRNGHDPSLSPLSMLLVDGDTVLAALDILFKEVEHEGDVYRAAGLSTVVSQTATRGAGYGRRLVQAAHDAMPSMQVDIGLFTCDRPLKGFYEKSGWRELDGTVLIGGTPADPFPSDRPGFDKVAMGDFFSSRARSNALLFHGSRIALYPGSIDKLW